MTAKNQKQLFIYVIIFFLTLATGELSAMGEAAEGWAVVQVTKLESAGLIYKSFEGTLRMATFEPDKECGPTEKDCYPPKLEERDFSIDGDNVETARFVNRNVGKMMVIKYKIHRIESPSLDTDFEVLDAESQIAELPEGMPRQFAIEKSGSKRNFTMYGRILRLEYRGLSVKSYEGIMYDRQRDQVHPFSLTDDSMANYVWNTMKINKDYYYGISEARINPLRATPYDIFEVNYDRRPETI